MKEYKGNLDVYKDEATKLLAQKDEETEAQLGPDWFAIRGLDQTMCRVGAPKQTQILCLACERIRK